ncbi:hypothetical protein SAMN05421505_107142 [Sinosporangium album]|uniref:Uncharacterized protein n=1 Tax=Sinosporangium album TaxID=504805 RepID=A0A1G7WQ60_9ACTN|nr:hypothetical protein [Sinosporangium album]SDG74049.1 hypothetical protein SAMN05421505_107142 [Sinosporangium album]
MSLEAPEAVFAVSALPCARSATMSPLGEFIRQVAGGLADSGCPPEFTDGPASADRADAELAAAGGDVDRAAPMSAPVRGLEFRFTMTEAAPEAPTETVKDVICPAAPGGYKPQVTLPYE